MSDSGMVDSLERLLATRDSTDTISLFEGERDFLSRISGKYCNKIMVASRISLILQKYHRRNEPPPEDTSERWLIILNKETPK